jgi:hypothetical protein
LTELETFPAFAVDIENKPKAAATRIAFALFIDIDIDVLMLMQMQIMMNSIRLGLGWIRRMKKSRCSAFCVLLRAPFASFDKVGGRRSRRSVDPTNQQYSNFSLCRRLESSNDTIFIRPFLQIV